MTPTLLIDLDGVLVRDKKLTPFEDTPKFINFLRSSSIPFRVLSNNSTKPPSLIVKELNSKGIAIGDDEFISPLKILPKYLKEQGVRKCLVLGSELLKGYLRDRNFDVSEDYHVDAVVVAQDRELNFQKIKLAVSAVYLKGAKLVPVNMSRIVKDDDGLYFPGAGSISLMIAHACNYRESIPNLGKPSPEFVEFALTGLPKDKIFIVSDDIYTDLIGAKDLGLETVFMTTGKYPKEEILKSGFTPDYTFDSLSEFMEFIEENFLV